MNGGPVSADRRTYLQGLLSVHDSAEAVLCGICVLCVAEVGVTGARVRVLGGTSADGGGAMFHTTDRLGARLDDLASTVGAGPCVDAYTLGRPVLIPNLAADGVRWPGFTADAITAGALAVFSFPLQLGGVRLGVLERHRRLADVGPADRRPAACRRCHRRDLPRPARGGADDAFGVSRHPTRGTPGDGDGRGGSEGEPVGSAVTYPRTCFAHQRTLAEVARDIIERRLWLDSGE
jgi:hypothetical protein